MLLIACIDSLSYRNPIHNDIGNYCLLTSSKLGGENVAPPVGFCFIRGRHDFGTLGAGIVHLGAGIVHTGAENLHTGAENLHTFK